MSGTGGGVRTDVEEGAEMAKLMTPLHPLWYLFIECLQSPEGCNFYEDENGGVTSDCGGDLSRSEAILRTFDDIDVEGSLVFFEEHQGHCDCEVVFNVYDSFMKES